MTDEEIKHLRDTATAPMMLLQKDSIWQEAFKEYNDDVKKYLKQGKAVENLGKVALHNTCKPCYIQVVVYLSTKIKNKSPWQNVVKK